MFNAAESYISSLCPEKGSGSTDWKLTEAGADPYAMIRCSIEAMDDPGKGGIDRAFDIMRRADELYPDNLDVKAKYLHLLFMKGHICNQIGASDQARVFLKQCASEFDRLRAEGFMPKGNVREVEANACMELGEMAYEANDYSEAFKLLARTDWEKYPFAAVLCVTMHMDDPLKYSDEIAAEVAFLTRAIRSAHWRTPSERATACYTLSRILATGVPNCVRADVDRAWACLQSCAATDPGMAKSEMAKYSRSLFGKLSYRQ